MKHVLISGGAGFIGSHLCERFLELGYAVTALDNLITGSESNLDSVKRNPNFEFIKQDVCESISMNSWKLAQTHGLQGVLHFACPASPVDFEKIPFDILAVDSIGTKNMVDLALRFDARLILASTSEIYGDPLVHPQTEDYWGNVNTLGPRACYDETKRFAEAYVSSAVRGKGVYQGKPYKPLNGGMVRIFNTYGPRMRPDDGRIVPEFCMAALRGGELTVHGEGLQTRSYCFVTDLVDGIVKLFHSQVTDPVNLGNPVERTVMDFAKVVLDLTGNRGRIKHIEARTDDPKRRCPDISRAKKLLNWSPQVDLHKGLTLTLDYFKKFL